MRVCVRLILCVRAVRDVGRHRGGARRSLTTGPIGINGPREGEARENVARDARWARWAVDGEGEGEGARGGGARGGHARGGAGTRARRAGSRCVFSFTPNSAAAERVFSLLKIIFTDMRDSALADIIQATLMLRYNERKTGHAQ